MTTQSSSGSPSTPTPDAAAPDDGSPNSVGNGSFPDATIDFGLKPRPRTRRTDPLIGTDLGGIRIVRLLGEGGMGRVYEAHQENPPRTVAVKVIRQGITSEKTMRRFEREAEFLGRLQHPCIAQIFVVGSYSSDDGDVPFFVMEFIPNAKPICNFAAERKLSLDERLRLFASICEAVAHGHDRGIIHRDLKPGNLLIDADGLPKVIDFGVARSTDSDFSLTSMKTDTGQLVGTVQYMSPEQFGDSPAGLDGRADVYSLGVVLYELLAGVLPYDVRKKKMHEAARIVCEDIPLPLKAVDRSIPRDVSLIVERCLEKNRHLRYQGAGVLAADLRQHLAGEKIPVSFKDWVRPPLRVLRRRGMAFALVAVAVVLAALGVVGIRWAEKYWEKPGVVAMPPGPPEIPTAVQDSLREATDSMADSGASAAATINHLQETVDTRIREVQKDSCERVLFAALPLWLNEADRCGRELSRAYVSASQAYPKAPDDKLVRRHEKWVADLKALRTAEESSLEDVKRSCVDLITAAEGNPAEDAFTVAEQEIKSRIEKWHSESVARLEALVNEASKDVWAYAGKLTGQDQRR